MGNATGVRVESAIADPDGQADSQLRIWHYPASLRLDGGNNQGLGRLFPAVSTDWNLGVDWHRSQPCVRWRGLR